MIKEAGSDLEAHGSRSPIAFSSSRRCVTGGQRKDKPGRVISARVLFDGSNGIPVKRCMREEACRGKQTFSFTAGVAEAHRQVPVDRRDWHLLGCQVEAGGDVFINTVGTYGTASASYHGSRVAASIGRITQYIPVRSPTTWYQLVVDDFHLEAGGGHYRAALITFFVLCAAADIPFSWGKTSGCDVVTWARFELRHRSYQLGISVRRPQWIINWTKKIAAPTSVNVIGRVMYVEGALEYERSFLGPLYRFSCHFIPETR